MEPSHWQVMAQLFEDKEIELAEVVKMMLIATATGLIKDEWEQARKVGYRVLDNSELNNALVLGYLKQQPTDQPVTYRQMADILQRHPQTIGGAVNRLIAQGVISKEDFGAEGAFYTLHPETMPYLPVWVEEFTKALIELHRDPEVRAATVAYSKRINFMRGFEVLRAELRQKFYRARKSKNQESE